MAISDTIRTYFNGTWHEGDVPIMRAADHGAWLGTTVFDGARYFEGMTPDLEPHLARVNRSAKALMLTPTVSTEDMLDIVHEGLAAFGPEDAVYIRPMYWGIDGDMTTSAIAPTQDTTGFALCLEATPMAPPEASNNPRTSTPALARSIKASLTFKVKSSSVQM
ncbi:MAG: aminotransferase class IV [Rhodobacteraceae bacterium]|nr:aminotransferase class IV [Paracoccaceae bacterium]